MTIAGLFVIIDGLAALAAFVGCLNAARRHPTKRYLWLVTAILMGYFIIIILQVMSGEIRSSFLFTRLFRPMMGALFVLIFSHSLVDGRRRG